MVERMKPQEAAERLRQFADDPMWDAHAEVPKLVLNRAADLIELQARQLEEAREALRPFANYMGDSGDQDNRGKPLPDHHGVGWVYLDHGQFRRALSTLKEISNG